MVSDRYIHWLPHIALCPSCAPMYWQIDYSERFTGNTDSNLLKTLLTASESPSAYRIMTCTPNLLSHFSGFKSFKFSCFSNGHRNIKISIERLEKADSWCVVSRPETEDSQCRWTLNSLASLSTHSSLASDAELQLHLVEFLFLNAFFTVKHATPDIPCVSFHIVYTVHSSIYQQHCCVRCSNRRSVSRKSLLYLSWRHLYMLLCFSRVWQWLSSCFDYKRDYNSVSDPYFLIWTSLRTK